MAVLKESEVHGSTIRIEDEDDQFVVQVLAGDDVLRLGEHSSLEAAEAAYEAHLSSYITTNQWQPEISAEPKSD